ncbi:hypothetical protein BBJ28_00002659 [Nothophytophthora sp. Chile5]|nr:hypothetical protein BBJ28_00002659 [Nothophytophthora sp. Chile5]
MMLLRLVDLSRVCVGSALPIVATSDPWCLSDATAARGFTVLALLAAIMSFVVSVMTALEIKTPTWNGEGKETTLVTSVVCSLFQAVILIPAVTMWQRMKCLALGLYPAPNEHLPRLAQEGSFHQQEGRTIQVYVCFFAVGMLSRSERPHVLRCLTSHSQRDGWTPLHWASRVGNLDIVRLLAKYGANLNVQDRWGTTPLMLTVVGENKVAAELLIELGAVVDARNVSSSLTGPHLHQLGMVFLNAGSDLTIQDAQGMTALHYAASCGNVNILMNILQLCDAELVDKPNTVSC